jgi:hypothetical protein
MRSKEELDAIALQWAEDTLQDWQNEYSAWDGVAEQEELTDGELEYCQSVVFEIKLK